MISPQRNIKYDILHKNESQSHRESIIPKININIKSLELPIINSNACFSDRIRFNSNKKLLKDFKDKNKYELNNKGLKMKYLTLKKSHNIDNILFLLRNIKIKKEKNNYKTPKKLKKINEPNLSYNNIYLNTNIENNNIKENIESYITPLKTENNKVKIKDKTMIHNIYFKWTIDNIDKIISKKINEENDTLNNSYDLSMSSLSSKNIFKNIKIKHNSENKKIKSAFISQTNNTKSEKFFEDKIKKVLNYNIKMINEENIDKKYINTKMFKNLLSSLSRNQKLNKSENKINSNINIKSSSKLENNNNYDNFQNYLLENGDNFLSKFLKKFILKNKSYNKGIMTDKQIEQNIKTENDIPIKNSYSVERFNNLKKEEIKSNDKIKQNENEKLLNSDIRKKHYNIILISSPGKITKEKKEVIESYNPIMKNIYYRNNNSKRINKNYINNDIIKILDINKEKDEKDEIPIIYKENNKNNNFHFQSLSQKNIFNIEQKNKKFILLKSTKNNNLNITNKSNININSNIIDETIIKDIINNNKENSILNQIDKNKKVIYNYNNKKEDASSSQPINNINYNYNRMNKNMKNDDFNYMIKTDNNININTNINIKNNNYSNSHSDINTKLNNNINTDIKNNINNKINKIDNNNNINNYHILKNNNNINSNKINYIKTKENDKTDTNEYEENTEKYLNKKGNDNLLMVPDDNNNDIDSYISYIKEKEINNIKDIHNNINNINRNNSSQKDENFNNIYENNKSRNPTKKSSVIINTKGRKNSVIRNKRRSTYINSPSKNDIKKQSIKKDIIPIKNITEANSQINKLILSDQVNEKESKDQSSINQDSKISEKDEILNLPSTDNKKISELDKILFKQKRKSKTIKIKRRKKDSENNDEEEQIEEDEDEDEFKYLNSFNKKQENFQETNEIIDLMNYNENDFIINNEFEISSNKSLTKEDMNKLILYSTKLRELSELKNKNIDKEQFEEIIQQIKEIKQKYNLIMNKYLMKQKLNNLTKNQKPNFKLNRKSFKILYEGNNITEGEIKKRSKKKEKKIHIRTKIEDSEEEEEKENTEEEKEKEENKKLIYDNSYLFNKNKKEKTVLIKKEVLDILNSNKNLNSNNNDNNMKNNSSENDFINLFNSRNKKYLTNIKIKNKFKSIRHNKPKKKPTDIYKLALFTDVIEEKIEKINDEENDKEILLEKKLERFFNEIKRMKENGIHLDNLDFLKNENKEYMTRLNEFSENINNLQIKDKRNKSKLNFLSPIQFKTNCL